jgi:hypothetical protein
MSILLFDIVTRKNGLRIIAKNIDKDQLRRLASQPMTSTEKALAPSARIR